MTSAECAYLIYTSGSTGRPKGVEVGHGSTSSFLSSFARDLGVSAADVLLSVTTLSFDISVLELFLPLVSGAQVVIADRHTAQDPVALARMLDGVEATILQATPTTWRMLIDSGWQGRAGLTAVSGGEPMSHDLARSLLGRCGRVWNCYGPTETTIYSTMHLVGWEDLEATSIPIGPPIDNTSCYVLDGRRRPLPVGVPGELFIGGAGLARGYLNRAELTAERFVADPFDPTPGARMYQTGDVCRLLPNGDLEALGRTDHQVKIRGYRVELGEIEHTLLDHPGIRAAVVTRWEPAPGDVRLAAYYVADEDAVTEDELRDHVKAVLPGYMVPAVYLALDALPMTSNNKVDRNRLPVPAASTREVARRLPETELQAQLVGIWCEVLGRTDIGIDDDFFDLGGHSLLATQIVSRIRAGLRVEVPVQAVFEHPTIAGLSEHVQATRDVQTVAVHAPEISRGDRSLPFPLSGPQERMWFIHQLHPEGSGYNMAGALRVRGPLDHAALAAAINDVVAHHEVLRTVFVIEDGAPVQRIVPEAAFDLPIHDWRSVPAGERHQRVCEAMESAAARPFELDQLPLTRFELHVIDDDDQIIFANTHHIIGDQWSGGILGRDIATCYAARCLRRAARARRAPVPVRRLRPLAPAVDGQRRHRRPARLLAPAARRRDGPRPTDRPSPPAGAERQRGHARGSRAPAHRRRDRILERHVQGVALHGDAGRARRAPLPLQRRHRHLGGHTDRQPQLAGERAPDRRARQHPRHAGEASTASSPSLSSSTRRGRSPSTPTPTRTSPSPPWSTSSTRRATGAGPRSSRSSSTSRTLPSPCPHSRARRSR